MEVFIVFGILGVVILLFFIQSNNNKNDLSKEYVLEFNRNYDQKKEFERTRLVTLKENIEKKFIGSLDEVKVDINDLPNDFDSLEFTCFDFQTANDCPLSAISIGISNFQGTNLKEIKEYRFKRGESGEFIYSHIHGLTENDLINAPPFADIWPAIKRDLERKLLVAYNAEFDIKILSELLKQIGDTLKGSKIICTYELAKKFMKDEPSYKLSSLCEYYKIPYWNHLNAYDAVSAGILFMHEIALSPGGLQTERAMKGKKLILS